MSPIINPSILFQTLILVHQRTTQTTKASITISVDVVMDVDASNEVVVLETIGSNNVASIMVTNIDRIMATSTNNIITTNNNNIMATNGNQNPTAGPMVCAATTAQLVKLPYQATSAMQPWITACAVTIVVYDGVGSSV